jgi:hypothetical protein
MIITTIIISTIISISIGFIVKIKLHLDLNKLINDIINYIKYPFIFLYKRFYIKYKKYSNLEYNKHCIKCNHTGMFDYSEPSIYYDKVENKMIRECQNCGYIWKENPIDKFNEDEYDNP